MRTLSSTTEEQIKFPSIYVADDYGDLVNYYNGAENQQHYGSFWSWFLGNTDNGAGGAKNESAKVADTDYVIMDWEGESAHGVLTTLVPCRNYANSITDWTVETHNKTYKFQSRNIGTGRVIFGGFKVMEDSELYLTSRKVLLQPTKAVESGIGIEFKGKLKVTMRCSNPATAATVVNAGAAISYAWKGALS